MKIEMLVLMLFSLMACNNTKKSNVIFKPFKQSDLLGSWSMTPGGKPAFSLDDKQIYFYEEEDNTNQAYSYRIGGDSIVMDLPDFSFSYKIQYMEGDSIRFITPGMKTTYYKLK